MQRGSEFMFANVLLEIKSKSVDKTFTYAIPDCFKDNISVGKRVLVYFGSQLLQGYVLEIMPDFKSDFEIKEIVEVIDEEVVLNAELMAIGQKMKEMTLSSLSSSYSTMLPSFLKAKVSTKTTKKYITFLRLNVSYEDAVSRCKNRVQEEIISLFDSETFVLKGNATEISASALKTLLKNQILIEEKQEEYRFSIENMMRDKKKELNEEQQNAFESITKQLNHSETFLIHGVTGSGKTEIYMQVIENVIKNEKSAIVLVPEISLTPQFVLNFARRFGSRIAVLHSGLSNGEKYDEWRKIMRGEVDIVIGARSAIFAPLKNIGVIILDECHADSYKQENRPRYHAMDMAFLRSEYHNCPLLLGSATPSLEVMARAKKGIFTLLELKKRVNDYPLPTCEIVDMADEMKRHHTIISNVLETKIKDRLEKKEQVMILLNRRGHSTTITCSSCGFTYKCPYCDISLTFHKSSKNLRCHYCGYTKYIDESCPNCKEDALNYYGLGTEKLESILKEKFPLAKILRMDTDTTSKKGSHEKIIESFRSGEYDILLGTQMISKGLDFPKVTLMGIVNADISLNIPDFRSGERTFALLYQASGRSGRSNIPGEVVLETFNPDNAVLKCVQNSDYDAFYQYEMNIRKTLKYPPYYYLTHLVIKGSDYELTSKEATKVKTFLKNKLSSNTIILGPTTANMFRINNIYHFEILLKYRKEDKLISVLKELDEIFMVNKKVDLDIDINY